MEKVSVRFNRTFMELKHLIGNFFTPVGTCFNRTFMELKLEYVKEQYFKLAL